MYRFGEFKGHMNKASASLKNFEQNIYTAVNWACKANKFNEHFLQNIT
jgi:hypothetical protein